MSARLRNSQADSILDLAVALDNSSVDQANALAAERPEARARLDPFAEHARQHGRPFWQILLHCDLAENQRRILSPQRAQRIRNSWTPTPGTVAPRLHDLPPPEQIMLQISY